jgi:hypothetical protein
MTVAKHQLAVGSLVWMISQPYDGYLYITEGLDSNDIGIRDNDLGLKKINLFPTGKKYMTEILKIMTDSKLIWITFRPAIYLICSLYLIGLVSLKSRNSKHLLIVMPLLFNSLGVLVTNPAQDLRYMYPAFLIAPIIFGYIFQSTNTNQELI